MKFDSTLVEVEGKKINIVAVDTNFFNLPQEEKGALVRGFVQYFNMQPVVLIAVNQNGDMQYYGRPDLTEAVSGLQFSEFNWTTNEIED